MGAEAFYDILKRLDMDALAEDLWQEAAQQKASRSERKPLSA